MPLLLLVALFIVVPIVELYIIIQVGQAIGVLPTIAILILDSVLGSILMRAQGRAAWRRFQEAIAAGRPPAREALDGVLVIFGGALLLTPGFASDILGLVLLLPPTRAVIRGILVRRATFGVMSGRLGGGGPSRGTRRRRPPRRGDPGAHPGGSPLDVEGTATEVDPRRLP